MPTQIKEDCPLRAAEKVVCTSYAPPNLTADLLGEFARRTQDQTLQRSVARIEYREQTKREGGGFAAAGVGLRDDVARQIQFGKQHRAGRLARERGEGRGNGF